MMLPPAELLAYGGMGYVALFTVWKTSVAPRLARRRAGATA